MSELAEMFERPGWQSDAACRGCDPDLFFPERGEATSEAKRICASCPVRAECDAFSVDERHGIWAGKSERQRREHRKANPTPRSRAERRYPRDVGHELPRGSVPYVILSRMSQEGAG